MNGSARSKRLQLKLGLLRPALSAAGARVLEQANLSEFYPTYITAMHGISRAAVPLMQEAINEMRRRTDEEAASSLIDYWEEHIPEEMGHDDWALEDLEVLGIDRSSVLGEVPEPTIAALVGAQYYWIRHVHPVALMGYLAVMEANPPSPESVELLEKRTRLPAAAFRSMRIHSKLDIKHGAEVFRVIDELPIDSRLEAILTISAMHTTELLTQALIELVDNYHPALPMIVPPVVVLEDEYASGRG